MDEKKKYASKQKEYRETRNKNIGETKALRRKEKETGNTELRRLSFVRNLINERGFTTKMLAEGLGTSPQSLNWILNVQDDCYLSVLQNILKCIGVDCTVKIRMKKAEDIVPEIDVTKIYEFEGDVKINKVPDPNLADFIVRCPKDGRCRFFADFVIELNTSVMSFCKKAEISYPTMRKIFEVQDIRISQLCRAVDKYDAQIIWNLNAIRKDGEDDGDA